MRTVRTKVYQFNELSSEAKQKAVSNLSDINVDYQWWESVYEDAENVGLKIKGFDIDRGSYCKVEFIQDSTFTAKKILQEHGENCETYKTAQSFINEINSIEEKAINEGKDGDEQYWYNDEIEEAENEFLKSLCEDYRIMLSKEFDYLTSEEAIIETIEANGYEFTKDGLQF